MAWQIFGQKGTNEHNYLIVKDDGSILVQQLLDSGLSISKGDITGASIVNKFGEAPDFDTGDNDVTVWDGANDALLAGGAMNYTYSSTADIGTISSSSVADTGDIEIQGLDTSYAPNTQTVTLDGQNDVSLSTNLIRSFRMKNVGSSDFQGVVYLRTNGSAQTNGVPDTANTVRAIVNASNNQTLMALYTVPANKTAYFRNWYASLAGAGKDSAYKITIRARPFGQVFQLKHVSAILETGNSLAQHFFNEPPSFSEKTDIEVRMQITELGVTAADVAAGFDLVLLEDS